MAWLVTHMWMVLAGATVFALMLGWSVRGMLLTGKMRKAIVDKDVALTELDQARDEIERLFAAQRAQRGEGGGVADASARKISDLTAELQKAKTELTTLKSEAAKAASAPRAELATERDAPTIVLPPSRGGLDEASEEAGAPAAESEAAEPPTLTWRNRHLEARVKHLEAQLAEMEAAPAPVPTPVPEEADIEAPAEDKALSVDEEGLAKLKWQADYLKQRVEALETELAKAPAEVPVVADEDANEEMARLRWRNRFLEGRLAYFEGGAGEEAAEPAAEKTGAEAMLEELEVTDTAADMTEAVEAMAEGLTVAGLPDEAEPDFVEVEDEASEEVAFETLAETGTVDVEVVDEEDTALIEEDAPAAFVEESAEPLEAEDTGPEEDESFADVSNDEEESLAEADHVDEDVLSDEEYDEEDFVEADDVEEEYDADADEADAFDDDDAEDDDFEDDDVEDDEGASDEQDETYDEEESWDEDDEAEDDFEDDEDTGSEEDEAYDDTEAFDDDEDEAEDEDESHEEDEVSDEAWDDEEDDADEDDASGEADEADQDEAGDETSEGGVTYEADDTIVPERPMAMNGPVEGHPDDLTLIGGIGPKIQVLLNELGVWHYDQIAEWTPENVAWMDEHLNFGGRITREGWVEQAAVLVRDAESV
ncbi:MAG: hypothetical protein ACPH9E_06200 [Hyphomonas sp.]